MKIFGKYDLNALDSSGCIFDTVNPQIQISPTPGGFRHSNFQVVESVRVQSLHDLVQPICGLVVFKSANNANFLKFLCIFARVILFFRLLATVGETE